MYGTSRRAHIRRSFLRPRLLITGYGKLLPSAAQSITCPLSVQAVPKRLSAYSGKLSAFQEGLRSLSNSGNSATAIVAFTSDASSSRTLNIDSGWASRSRLISTSTP